jgi:hypothetical protein
MNNLLVAVDNLHVLLNDNQTLIGVVTHGEDTPEHLQEARVVARGGGGTTTTGSVSRSHNWRRGRSVMSPWILRNCGVKRLMCNILVEFLMCQNFNHALNVGSKSTGSLRV